MRAKTTRLEIRLSPHDLEVLDRRRGNQTRSDWLRRKIHEPEKTEVRILAQSVADRDRELLDRLEDR